MNYSYFLVLMWLNRVSILLFIMMIHDDFMIGYDGLNMEILVWIGKVVRNLRENQNRITESKTLGSVRMVGCTASLVVVKI